MAEKKYDAARQTLGELLRGTPAPANAFQIRLDGAVCLMELGKFDQAAVELESLSADRSAGDRLGETLYRLAFSLHKTSKYEASHAACARLAAASGVSAEFSRAAAELDAENLFLLGKYGDAAPAFERLAKDARDERRGLQWRLRIGQCAYFGGDYARAVALLTPLAEDQRASAAPELQGAIFLLGDALLQQGKEREAAAALARYVGLAKEGNLAEAKYKLGLARLRSGDKQGAEKTLADLVSGADDRSAWVQRGLLEYGQILQKAGKLNEAEAALRRVIEAKAPVELAAPATYVLGWVAFDAKQYAQAAERWGQVAEKYSSHALAEDAAFRRGIALKEAGQAEQAAKALQGFADAHPQSSNAVQARQMAAACLAAEGKNDQATAVLASLAMSPKAGDSVLYDLAWAQRGQKNDGAAAETYARLLKEHPESKLGPAVRVELAEILYGQKAYEGATELLEAAMKADRVDAKLRANAAYRLGWCYQKLGKAAKAAEAFGSVDAKATGSDEIAASAVLQAGLAYADAGRFDQSEAALTRFVKEYSTNGQVGVAMLKLGEVQAEEGKYAESAGTFAAFLQKDPKDPFACRAHFGIGWALENQKKYEEARASYQRAIASTNGETAARAQFQVGETYLYERKFDQAIPALLAVEDVYAYPTWSARALLEAGRAFEELKQADQAKKQYEQLISKYKDAPEAGAARDRLAALARH
jgi:TolA-binding protein